MKLTILAAATAVIALVVAAGTAIAAYPPPTAGVQDHEWNVTMTSTAAGAHPDTTVVLKLGQGSGVGIPDTSFFHDATTSYQGVVPACSDDATASCLGTHAHLGDQVGSIAFNLQTNAHGTAGNINPATGQTFQCDSTGLTASALAINTPIYSASVVGLHSPSDGAGGHGPGTASAPTVTSTEAKPASVHTYDQDADPDHGGMPMAVSHIPDWFPPLLAGIGLDNTYIIQRSFAQAKILGGASYSSVGFLTVNPKNGTFVNLTVIGNPLGTFNSKSQTNVTCPKFDSTVVQAGVSTAAANWPLCKDYEGNAVASCTAFNTAVGGVNLSTVETPGVSAPLAAFASIKACDGSGVTPSCFYKITVSTTPDLDSDARFAGWDNCVADANAGQADANSNGIGDACATGGSTWTNGTTTDAGGACGVSFATAPPWNVCQDQDQDGALNGLDNCPLVPNADLNSWLKTNTGTSIDNQGDNDRDGIGNACDPAPNVPGDGKGWKAGITFTGGTPYTPSWAAGTYNRYTDTCDDGFKINGATLGETCQSLTGNDQGRLDSGSSASGIPDFYETGAGNNCLQNHVTSTANNGYANGDMAAPAAPACINNGSWNLDPLAIPTSAATQVGCYTNNQIAQTDMNNDGSMSGLDLGILAGSYGKFWLTNDDPNADADLDGNHSVDGLDLGVLAGYYGKSVAVLCPKAATAVRTTPASTDQYTITWDRQVSSTNTITFSCTGGTETVAVSTYSVKGVGGKFDINDVPVDTRGTCSVKFNGVELGPFS